MYMRACVENEGMQVYLLTIMLMLHIHEINFSVASFLI